jgi:Methyltransferase domain
MAGNSKLIESYAELHATELYGATSLKNLRLIRPEIKLLHPQSIIDYGCGQSMLIDRLDLGYPLRLERYDPAIPAFAEKPKLKADLLINIDVLEHIEESDLDDVLAEMRALCRDALIIVDTAPAKRVLADGRNLHVTLKPHDWWRTRIARHFGPLYPVRTLRRARAGFKTWQRSAADTMRYHLMRTAEDARYYAKRMHGKSKLR